MSFREMKLLTKVLHLMAIQFSSVAQSYPTLCNPKGCSMPGLPVHHQLSELAQTHVPWVGDAIQPSHPLSSLSPPSFHLSQHQGLFQWINYFHQVASIAALASAYVLPVNIQDWFPLGLTGLISLLVWSKGLSRVFNTTVQKHQFFGTQLSLCSNSHIHTMFIQTLIRFSAMLDKFNSKIFILCIKLIDFESSDVRKWYLSIQWS